MTNCKFLSECIFFNDMMLDMPTGSKIFKRQFCLANFNNCARFKIAKAIGSKHVPSSLFPNQSEEAEEIIKKSEN